jgi:hypothetical protein
MSGRVIYYAGLTAKGPKSRHPHGTGHYEAEVSFDVLGENSGWINIRNDGGGQIDLCREEAIRLAHLIIKQYPLEALADL